ncbi:C4-dicarboxylate transporter DcuC [Aliivibrio sp. S4TY2]|uniref:C4-dicarboxylate transporter DcuC n=1 Tax=unclassified Aliivibrio TaxID=2645654 RepID=UPI002378239F|nr:MULTISPECIES: C4-dicarboxylate transporter DcuC [unclassified Aliivibrio]MDD9155541.1 C4-dicarboxylate transporter DcuC [Aliivibrio sp. S4TY2]MDD9160408.1 C4-dicarboxylate transporter DcuC [Aliivibrio sp. S4TY1]MDD9164694.1 C4-dicarboxylate transporter DcuC [Aliivibrio sp. S4MY2]MDD9168500.1 C4-dicarboxylate transporter DcuC [Aliivibrio sp. S4MY4]MDD9185028.1 C4-dicarboxylate transporter DcuC [Aliivibrio sp. S4MY3]
MSLFIALCGLIFAGRLILKNYNPQGVLFFVGIAMMAISIFTNNATFVDKSTGWIGFDIFEYISMVFGKQSGGLGLKIMLIGGFALLMSAIGASQVMVKLTANPLMKLNSPYLMLALAFILGQMLSLFISSATGLGLLLMATLYPVLIRLGCSKAGVASVLASTCAIEFGPGSGNSILAAQTAGVDITEYFVGEQLPIISVLVIVVAIIHAITQRFFDRNDEKNQTLEPIINDNIEPEQSAPLYYVMLPMLPLFFMLTFSNLGVKTISVDMATAIVLSIFISLSFEFIRERKAKSVFEKLQGVFNDMGKVFASVVTLIIAGQTFSMGLKSIGAVDSMLHMASSIGLSAAVIILFMALLTFVISALMGSGNAAFFSFAPMVPQIANKIGANTVDMILPIQLSAGFGRTISPIAGVIIAVAGISGLSPFDIVRRTFIPMISGWLLMLILTFSKGGQLMQLMPFLIGIIILVLVCLWRLKKNSSNKQIQAEL